MIGNQMQRKEKKNELGMNVHHVGRCLQVALGGSIHVNLLRVHIIQYANALGIDNPYEDAMRIGSHTLAEFIDYNLQHGYSFVDGQVFSPQAIADAQGEELTEAVRDHISRDHGAEIVDRVELNSFLIASIGRIAANDQISQEGVS